MKTDEIEEVTDEMLQMLIKDHPHVAVLFCKFPIYAGNFLRRMKLNSSITILIIGLVVDLTKFIFLLYR